MEICHLFQIRNLNFDEALNDLENLGLDIFIPDTLTMINAFKIQKTYRIDPYDSIVLASAIECNCDYIITRDKIFIKKGKELMDLLTPEEFLDKLKLSLG
jgi:predicted nucleic acid-binding protein